MDDRSSFLGRGWSFPPRFINGGVQMSEDEADIQASLHILFGTAPGERFLHPDYGLDMRALMFEPFSTTLRSDLKDRIQKCVLVHEARIRLLDVDIDDSRLHEGVVCIRLDYRVRSTNSRFNLVFPFYQGEAAAAARTAHAGS